jgi:type I restriction enzyme M protein
LVNESLPKRGELSLGLFWIKSKSLTDTDSLPPSDVTAAEIAYDLAAALEEFTRLGGRLLDDRSVPVGWISEV